MKNRKSLKKIYLNFYFRVLIAILLLILPIFFVPQWFCSLGANKFYKNDRSVILPLAETVRAYTDKEITSNDFSTGSNLFNGEWLFGSYMMTAMGLLQTVHLFPDTNEKYLPTIENCLKKIITEEVKQFDKNSWNEDPIESLGNGRDHAAYLGYFNLLLGYYRIVIKNPKVEWVHLNEKISEALIQNLEKSQFYILETYPSEFYPVDNASVISSIQMYSKISGKDITPLMQKVFVVWNDLYLDKKSGLLYQSVANDGFITGKPRASGTALAAYFFSFAFPEYSKKLYLGLKKSCYKNYLGFGVMNEYPVEFEGGVGDIDSGPVIMGASFSATGFSISAARNHDDYSLFLKLFRISSLIGSPIHIDKKTNYVCGGPLGNSIMLTMLTAPKLEAVK